jgi:hypothetical protein
MLGDMEWLGVFVLSRGGCGVGLTQTEVCYFDDGMVGAGTLDEDVGRLGV